MAKFKTDNEIVLLRESGKRLARVLNAVAKEIKPGVTTKHLDEVAEQLIRATGDTPPFLNYIPHGVKSPFPASLCVSVNEEIVHGIPGERIIQDGDIVSIDLGLTHNGMITDAALTIPVGNIPPEVALLIAETKRGLMEGIKAIRPGARIGDIGAAIERVANERGYGVVRELGGHGVGHAVHEEPYVPNYGRKGTGPLLKAGMVLAIEPMFMLGRENILLLPDHYTVITEDGSLSAHFEHSIVVTKTGVEILTIEQHVVIINDVTNEECIDERRHLQIAYQSFVVELEYINTERGLLLQEATRALEEAAAQKLRLQIRQQLSHNGN